MKLLLTSGGVRNASIHAALLDLLGKPIAECDALLVPTALYAHPYAGPRQAYRTISGQGLSPMVSLGWRSVGLLELTALPSLGREAWEPVVRDADVLLVDGGDAAYLCHWLKESGVADLLPSLDDTVWVSVSAGSMVLTPRTGPAFIHWPAEGAEDRMLGLVDFSIFPHLDVFPTNTMAAAETWAAELGNPGYAADDDTAFKVVDGTVEVVSEGTWKLL